MGSQTPNQLAGSRQSMALVDKRARKADFNESIYVLLIRTRPSREVPSSAHTSVKFAEVIFWDLFIVSDYFELKMLAITQLFLFQSLLRRLNDTPSTKLIGD